MPCRWERTISNQGICWILEFCEEEQALQDVFKLARELQPLACSMVEEGFSLCGTDPTELRQKNHILSIHFQAQRGLETLAAAAGALQTHDSLAEERNAELEPQCQHLYAAPPTQVPEGHAATTADSEVDLSLPQQPATSEFRRTSLLRLQHDDGQAIESLAGVALPTDGVGCAATSGDGALRSRLDINDFGESTYSGTHANLANWRPADQGQYMWQGNEMAENNWGVWWEGWNLGDINVPLMPDDQSTF